MNDLDYFKANGWHQGSIINDKNTIQALVKGSFGLKSSDHLPLPELMVIISQNCDILHHRAEDEPYIDFLTGRFHKEKDGNLLYGKNPRRLQIEHGKMIISFIIHDVLRVTKDTFKKINPIQSSMILAKEEIKQIINWISKRYARAAFPDEFNNRLSKAKQIEKASKNSLMGKVSLIFIDTSDEELVKDQNYKATLIIGVKHNSNHEIKSQVEDLFFNTFNIPGIEAEIEVYDEYDITYETISMYKRFDWDFRSPPGNYGVTAPVPQIDNV